MNDAIDNELRASLLEPPEGFAERVLTALPERPGSHGTTRASQGTTRLAFVRAWVEWFALGGAFVAGMTQLIPLLFGIWAFSSAG